MASLVLIEVNVRFVIPNTTSKSTFYNDQPRKYINLKIPKKLEKIAEECPEFSEKFLGNLKSQKIWVLGIITSIEKVFRSM